MLLDAYDAITIQPESKPQPSPRAAAASPNGTSSAYAQAALTAEAQRVRQAAEGSRNDTLNQAAFALGQLVAGGEIDEATVQAALLEAALDAGLGEAEAERTIESGLAAGEAQPRTAPPSNGYHANGYDGFGPAPGPFDETASSTGLPRIQVNNRQLRDIRAEALAALRRANEQSPAHPRIYVSSGQLARVVQGERNVYSVQMLDSGSLTGILADTADWLRVGKESRTHVTPPQDVTRDVLTLGEWPDLPGLDGIVGCPTAGPDGQLHDAAGYSPQTRLYYASWIDYPRLTPQEALRVLLDELLVDFPFHDAASRANAVGLALLGFVRPLINGATPLHLVDAPIAGTGKGLLADVLIYISTGHWPGSMSAGRDDDEWRKRLTSTLIRGESHIYIDNIDQTLASASLATALTQHVWHDRLLGQTRTVAIPLRQIWCANGNNVNLSDEIARRTIWIRLDANSEKPWLRSGFKHPDLREWVAQNRPLLVGACIALVQAWLDAGRPSGSVVKGSYSAWARTIGGILQVAGIDGFLANERQLFEQKTNEVDNLADFVNAWVERFGTGKVSSRELFKLASTPDQPDALSGSEWLGLLDDILAASNERGRRRSLGRILSNQQDKVIAGHKIVREGRSNGDTWWRLLAMQPDADAANEFGL